MDVQQISLDKCPDTSCGVIVGQRHLPECGVARCKEHGSQRISCTHQGQHSPSLFRGQLPGASEAVTRGWFCRLVDGQGWVSCTDLDQGATPDINRVLSELTWNTVEEIFE